MIDEIIECQKKIDHIMNYGGSLEDVEKLMNKQIELIDKIIKEYESDD